MPTNDKFDDDIAPNNPLSNTEELVARDVPPGVDRRTFIMLQTVLAF